MRTQPWFFSRPRLWGLLWGLTLAVAQFFTPAGVDTAQAATTTCTPNGAAQDCTVTFSASGAPETWTVPAGVTSATFDLYGAQGGGFDDTGRGGRVTATLAVTPGASYQVRVGVWGFATGLPAGYNGGGAGYGPGGGASDVRSGAFGLADRLLVAGGGGGTRNGVGGGIGGYPSGGAGGGGASGGGGGTQTAGGAGGVGTANGSAGTLGQGGAGGIVTGAGASSGDGGGGGYYGGGGGAASRGSSGGGGGGGSSYATPAATNVSFQTGVRSQNGQVIISYTLVDTTAPVANPTQSPAAAPSGWNNTNVTVNWNWSDGISGIDAANCTTSSVASGSATVTVTATCRDLAGNSGTATYSVRIDPTAPTTNPSQSPAANGAGWNNTDVTVNWNWTFTGAEIDTANCTTSSTSSGEGTLTLSATCRDVATNQRTVTYGVKVDKTAPVVTVTGVSAGAAYEVGAVPTAACTTSDALSGVATQAAVAITGGGGPLGADGTGSFTATCSGATDVAGNSAAPVSVTYTVNPPPDTTAPVITPNVVGTLGNNGWYVSDVAVSWTVVDNESAISSQSGCDPVTVNADTAGDTFTCAATSSGGSSSQSVTLKRDATAPTISAAASSTPNANGWYNSNVTVQFTCNDNLSGVVSCPADETLSSEGSAVSSTAQTITDQAGNSSAASNSVTVQIDKTAPVVTVTGVSDGASYTVGSVPTAGCSTTDALSGVATQATTSVTGGNSDGTGSFTATCSGATDLAGNSSSASVSYTVNAPVDACTTSALRDNFNRANGGLGSNWAGATNQSFYKIAGNRVNVQLGGPVLWKPTTFGVNQAAFVTLSALDALSPSQGVLLKVQGGTIPNAGAIAVVYDSLAKAVRVSTLRLNTPTWTVYGNTPATFANGDQLLGCVQADGTVRVYRNNSLLTTVTLNATDQSFFNAKGGKIGLWTVAAFNAFVDDFGGGALTGVSSATLDATTVPDETADDGTEITVAENFPTDDTAAAPDDVTLVNRAFLPLVNR